MEREPGGDRVKELPPRRGGVYRSVPSDGAISRDLTAIKIKDGHKPYVGTIIVHNRLCCSS